MIEVFLQGLLRGTRPVPEGIWGVGVRWSATEDRGGAGRFREAFQEEPGTPGRLDVSTVFAEALVSKALARLGAAPVEHPFRSYREQLNLSAEASRRTSPRGWIVRVLTNASPSSTRSASSSAMTPASMLNLQTITEQLATHCPGRALKPRDVTGGTAGITKQ